MRVGVILFLALAAGCSEWPRMANVPPVAKVGPADARPGDLVVIDWSRQAEPTEVNDLPTDLGTPNLTVAHGSGQVIDGSLAGIGWADALEPAVLTDSNCPGNSGTRSPLGAGDYIGDVDFVVVSLGRGGTLCASLEIDAASVGWDLVPHRADPCGIPLEAMSDSEGEPVGVDLGGDSGGWAMNVDADDRVAIGLAGYHPNDDEAQLAYALALALVAPSADGSEGVCPTHPDRSDD